jgi:hypothetical protein
MTLINIQIVGSNPTRVWMSVWAFSVFVLPCVDSSLVTGSPPVQGVLPTVYKIHNFGIKSEW